VKSIWLGSRRRPNQAAAGRPPEGSQGPARAKPGDWFGALESALRVKLRAARPPQSRHRLWDRRRQSRPGNAAGCWVRALPRPTV